MTEFDKYYYNYKITNRLELKKEGGNLSQSTKIKPKLTHRCSYVDCA